ncbi:MAG: hypothetical protein ACTHKG_03770 [Nocardioides sp.]
MTRFEDELTRSLTTQVDRVDWPAASLDEVKRGAGRIQRKRRVALAAATAVVLAILVPAGLVVAGDGPLRSDRDSGPIATNAPPSPAPSPDPSTKGGLEVPLRTDVQSGGAPRIPYMYDGHIVRPDGTQIDVGHQLMHVTPYRGGWMGVLNDKGVPTALVVDAAGNEVQRFVSAWALAVDSTQTRIAYIHRFDSGGTLNLGGAGQGDDWSFAEHSNWQPIGILDSGTVVYNDDSIDPVAMLADPGGTQPIIGLQAAMGVSVDGLVSGRVSLHEREDRACYAVMDPATSSRQFTTCKYSLWKFSPDGRYVFAHPPIYDGNFVGQSVAILDARSGEPIVQYSADGPSGPWIRDVAWEDQTHLLATVYEGTDRWYVLRLALDGTIENVTKTPLPGGELDSPVLFSARP